MVAITNDKSTAEVSADFPKSPGSFGLARRLKAVLRRGVLQSAVPFRRWLGNAPAGSFGILMYHRVTPPTSGVSFPTWNVTPRRLHQQLTGLLKRGFQPLRLRDALERHDASEPVPANSFVVTFDDGYANNYTEALPILRALNVPATIFLATAYLDSDRPIPSDDWSAAGSPNVPTDAWRPLTGDEAEWLNDDELIELGAHTHTHADFRGRPHALKADLATCLSVLRTRFGIERPTFAFPYGTKHLGFSGPTLAAAAKAASVRCALTTESELVTPQCSPFDWGRFTAESRDTAGTLAVKLTGSFGSLRKLWRGKQTHALEHRSRPRMNIRSQEK